MKHKVNIKTLSPVHIGSGEDLQVNYRYIFFPKERVVAILDDNKMLEVIQEENIQHWIDTLDKEEDMLAYLNTNRKLDVTAEMIAARVLRVEGTGPLFDTKKEKNIREQAFTGLGQAMIAGSSLKGAIRTAVLNLHIEEDKSDFYKKRQNITNRQGRFSDEHIQSKFLGQDPNHDIFRLLRVGDIHFETGTTECLLTKTINLKGKEWTFKTSTNTEQFIECIPTGATAAFNISYNKNLVKGANHFYVSDKRDRNRGYYPLFEGKDVSELELPNLFESINKFTKMMLEEEFKFWEEEKNYPNEVEEYLDYLDSVIYETIEKSDKNTCIIRLGWGTGFNSITGGWQNYKMNDRDLDKVIETQRPKHPTSLLFPKTRRMTEAGMPLGFVQLTLDK